MEKNYKTCPVCGKQFPSPPSDKTVTCSRKCSSVWRSRMHKGKSNKWSDEAKERFAGNEAHTRQAREVIKKATAVALSIPEGQKGPQNRACKVWYLKDAEGNEHIVTGLLPWARENYRRFFPDDDIPVEEAAKRISGGIRQIAISMRKKGSIAQYKGWTLTRLPEEKGDYNLEGRRFGALTVLQELGRGRILCKCDCGNIREMDKWSVTSGDHTSCGCRLVHKAKSKETIRDIPCEFGNNTYKGRITTKKLNKNNKSGIRGVCKEKKRWVATIGYKGEQIRLGSFPTIEEAAAVRREAEKIYYKQFFDKTE